MELVTDWRGVGEEGEGESGVLWRFKRGFK